MRNILRLFSGKKPQSLAVFAVLFVCVLMVVGHHTAYATGPGVINFQGKVVNADGTNVTNGSYNFDFIMYDDPTAGTNRWQELTKSVTVTNGVFQTNLGSATALPNFNTYPALYLAVRFNADAAGYMSPRVQMASVPYALNADNLGGIASSGFVQLGATQSGNINISSGTITSGLINGQTVSSSANFTGTLTVQGAGALILGTASSIDGATIFKSSGGTNTITLQAPATNPSSSYTLKLPTAAPSLSQCLQNDGTTIGQLTFAACSAGGGDSITINGSAATDANFLDTTATSTITGTTFTLSTVPNPDTVALTISNATTTTAGAVTAGAQSFGGDKTFQTTTNSTTGFQVQNSAGADILNIDTTDANLATNPGFEVNATGWVAANITAPTRVTTSEYLGFASGAVASVTSAGEGFKQVLATTLANGTYTISWYDKLVSGPAFTDVIAAMSNTGGAPSDCTSINTQTVVSTGWTRHWCQVTASSNTASNYITIRQVAGSTARTWNIDGVQVELGATATAYGAGTIMINSNIISPTNFKNAEDSTTAFQVQTANGTNLATFDTVNSGLTFAGDTTLNAQKSLRFADSDSSNYVAFKAPTTVATNVTWELPAADSAGCFKSNGAGIISLATCGDIKTETITATGTWNQLTGAIVNIVELWGGGGSGGAGQAANSLAAAKLGGGAGGGGAYNTASFSASNIGVSVPVTIGAGATGGTGVANANGNVGAAGGQTCFSTTTACAGTMYITAFGGGGGAAAGVGNGGGGGGGIQGVGQSTTTTAGGTGGAPTATAASTANAGFGGAGGVLAIAAPAAAGAGAFGGGGGGASSTTGANNSGVGGGSNHGGGGGGGGGGCAVTTCTIRAGGAGGLAGNTGSGSAGGSTGGQAGTGGTNGFGFGGGGGGGGAATSTSGTSTGGAGGAGGRGEVRITTIRGTGADLAEIYSTKDSSIGPGDIVSLDPDLHAGVRKSTKAYDNTAFGIISTTPSLVMGSMEDAGAVPAMVALAGRVPTKVNLQNGPIKPGDFLTPSSTPGIAMKATKAGQIVAQAMIGFDGSVGKNADGTGLIVAFVKNQTGNGSGLSDLITGLPTIDDGSAMPDLSKLALAQLATQKDQLATVVDLSEITTDRVMAGLEVITPSIVTDALTTNSIGSSGGGDISFLLDAHNKLVVKGKNGGQSFSVDATGNAVFGVSLVSLGSIEARGGLKVDGDALFGGKATFAKLAEFQGDIDAQGRVTFNKDAGGMAQIPKGGTRVDVTFDKPYAHPPIVAITLIADQVTLPNGTVEDSKLKEQRLFNAGYSYLVSNSTAKGFTIVLNKKAAENLQFSWNAVAIKNPGTANGLADADDAPTDSQVPQQAATKGQQ